MSQDPPPTTSKRGWFHGAAALLLAGALWLVLRSNSEHTPPVTTPTWTHEYPGKGIIHSVTASKQRDGTEVVVAAGYAVTDDSGEDLRIVAYAADTGQILWEKREAISVEPRIELQPIVSCDEDGHVLWGSIVTAASRELPASLYKLSIEDGSELWRWSPGSGIVSTGSGHLTVAAASSRSLVWVSGIRKAAGQGVEKFLSLLDAASGQQRWLTPLNTALSASDRPAEVHPLSNSDAVVMTPPRQDTLKFYPWILQRVDEATGTAKWQMEFIQSHAFFRSRAPTLDRPIHVVDEANGQVLVFWIQGFGMVRPSEVRSIDLATGVERWCNRSGFFDLFSWGLSGSGLDSSGNPVLYGGEYWTTENFWPEWHFDASIRLPMPVRRGKSHHRPICVTFSPMDGSVVSQTRLSNRNEVPLRLLYQPGTQFVRAVFVRQANLDVEFEPWRAIRLDAIDSLPTVGGPESNYAYSPVSTLTPSGRIVTTGDPNVWSTVWRIEVW